MEGTRGVNVGKHKLPGSPFSIATPLTNVLQEGFPRFILADGWYTAHRTGLQPVNSDQLMHTIIVSITNN